MDSLCFLNPTRLGFYLPGKRYPRLSATYEGNCLNERCWFRKRSFTLLLIVIHRIPRCQPDSLILETSMIRIVKGKIKISLTI